MPKYTDDITLWTAFQRGEPKAEAEIFQQYFKPACLFAESITGAMMPAEDIVAETLIKVWNRRQEFQALSNAKAFLYRAIRNASINYAIAEKQHRKIEAKMAYLESTGNNSTEEVLEHEILRVELLQEIYNEIDNLPGRCSQIFKMIFIGQRSTQEIADELGINVQTVRTQKARAIELLKTELLKKHRLETLLLFYLLLEKNTCF